MNRTQAPAFSQPKDLEIQLPVEIELENGARLFWIKDVKDDSVKLDIEWCAGSKYQDKKLVANFTNKLLLSGNDSWSGKEIANEIDFYGGYIQHELDRDHAGMTLYGLVENMADIFGVFRKAMLACDFPAIEFEKERTVSLSRFKIETKKVKNTCRRKFNKSIFGEKSAYGQVAVEADFEAINRADVKAFYKQYYLDAKPTIFLVGNVDDAFIELLRNWSAELGSFVPDFTKEALEQEKGKIHVPVKDAIQTAVRVGRLMFDKNHPDYFKFQLLNTTLGGYFGSRLMANIREDKGYTYGIGSGMSVMEHAAYFFIATEVAVEVKGETVTEIFKEIARLRTDLIPEDELAKVKNYMLGDFLRHADGAIAMMENFKNIHFNQLKTTYYSDFIHAINAATAEELRVVAQKYWSEDDLVVVTAG